MTLALDMFIVGDLGRYCVSIASGIYKSRLCWPPVRVALRVEPVVNSHLWVSCVATYKSAAWCLECAPGVSRL